MSGSGGSDDWKFRGQSSGSNGASSNSGPGKCQFIHTTQLNSPNPAVLQTLKIGDQLAINYNGTSIVATNPLGLVAGSITYKHLVDLIECIGEGWEYVALVVSINAGSCMVRIQIKE